MYIIHNNNLSIHTFYKNRLDQNETQIESGFCKFFNFTKGGVEFGKKITKEFKKLTKKCVFAWKNKNWKIIWLFLCKNFLKSDVGWKNGLKTNKTDKIGSLAGEKMLYVINIIFL